MTKTQNKEFRAAGSIRADGERKITGYAAIFDSPTNIGGMFIEKIARGAFARALDEGHDVRALFDHDSAMVLGRSKAGTLRMEEDERGLKVEIDLPDTQQARDLVVSMERGDIDQMSFGFMVRKQEWDDMGDIPTRTITDVDLFDVSVVTYPAYADTEAQVRSISEQYQEHIEETQEKTAPGIATRLHIDMGLLARGAR